jgi:hypothetical protein
MFLSDISLISLFWQIKIAPIPKAQQLPVIPVIKDEEDHEAFDGLSRRQKKKRFMEETLCKYFIPIPFRLFNLFHFLAPYIYS